VALISRENEMVKWFSIGRQISLGFNSEFEPPPENGTMFVSKG
jgi:hypothetical protein